MPGRRLLLLLLRLRPLLLLTLLSLAGVGHVRLWNGRALRESGRSRPGDAGEHRQHKEAPGTPAGPSGRFVQARVRHGCSHHPRRRLWARRDRPVNASPSGKPCTGGARNVYRCAGNVTFMWRCSSRRRKGKRLDLRMLLDHSPRHEWRRRDNRFNRLHLRHHYYRLAYTLARPFIPFPNFSTRTSRRPAG